MQEDVSETAAMEHMLADLAESQLTMASQIFPKHIIEYMATSGPSFGPEQVAGLARQHHHVTILFMDIVGFTSMSKEVPPEAVMAFLNTLFGHFDNLCDKHGVLKLETAGDCYIVAGGITSPTLHGDDGQGSTKGGAADEFNTVVDSHDVQLSAARVLAFAKDMLAVLMPHNQQPVVVRVGLHTGDCVSGLIGTKVPKFAVLIQASKPTASLLPEEPWEATGGIEVKGKGLMETFIWGGQLPDFSLASQPAQPAPWSAQNPHPLQGPTNLPSPSTTALSSGSLARLSGAARAPSQPRSSPADSLMHLSTSSLPPGNIAWATASNPVPGSGSLLPDPATIAAGTQSHDANVQRFHSLASWQLDSLISAPGSCHAEGDASARSRQPVNAEWNDATEIMLPFPTRGVADTAQRTTPNLSQASAAAAALRQWTGVKQCLKAFSGLSGAGSDSFSSRSTSDFYFYLYFYSYFYFYFCFYF
ncbi:nucleotide cyclase [Haematococcus lacustris]